MARLGRRSFDDRIGATLGAANLPMSKPNKGSALYRLIEAGQLARMAVADPLTGFDLQPGDDAVLFLLGERGGVSEAGLAAAFGRDPETLAPRIDRLLERELVARRAVGPELALGLVITDAGEAVRALLADNWVAVEQTLIGGLPKKQRKALRRALKEITAALQDGSAERYADNPPVDQGDRADHDEGEDDQPR